MARIRSTAWLLFLLSVPTFAQTMNFSVYTGVSMGDDGILHNAVTVQDNSTGCTHSNYNTSALITGPNSTQASSGWWSGLSANASLDPAGNYGQYNFSGTVQYFCSCIHNTAGAGGGGQGAPLVHIEAYYYWNGYIYKRCTPKCTICDNLTLNYKPNWNYGLFDGAEIQLTSVKLCAMRGVDQTTQCYTPDPIPGQDMCGGVGKVSPLGTRSKRGPTAIAARDTLEPATCPALGISSESLRE